ncbi:MAG: tetratricopeptide repeat protein [Candidatus Hydrogenedentes bacterium]|nr:tetratricopeptide repeat protein [Candidatus Hydrogenedentota bacterium]
MSDISAKYKIAACLLLVAVSVLSYLPVFSADFSGYDDPMYVTANETVQSGLNVKSALWAITTDAAGNWHPLTWFSHLLDVELFGMDARGHHVTSLLIHVINVLLLLWLLHQLTGAFWRSALVAALFAVHPLNVESVAWIAERKNVLSTSFWFLATLSYVRFARSRSLGWYVATAGTFALGLLAKPMLVTFPFTLLLLDFWPLRRAESEVFKGKSSVSIWSALAREKIPLIAISAVFSIIVFFVQRAEGSVTSLASFPFHVRIENAFIAYAHYLQKMLLPFELVPHYPHPGANVNTVLAVVCGLAIFGVTIMCVVLSRRHPHLIVGWLWYLGTLIPVIGIVQVGSQAYADRYAYIPLLGVFMMIAWSLPEKFGATARGRKVTGIAFAIVIALLGARTWDQSARWHNALTLNTYGVAIFPEDVIMRTNLMGYYFTHEDLEKAEYHASLAVEHKPRFSKGLYNLGVIRRKQERHIEAIELFRKALRRHPEYLDARQQLGNALHDSGDLQGARAAYEKALDFDPEFTDAQFALGHMLLKLGDAPAAEKYFWTYIELEPDQAQGYGSLGLALASQDLFDSAINQFSLAIALDPDDVEYRFNLGTLLMSKGRAGEALPHLVKLIDLLPNSADAHYALGQCLQALGQDAEAMKTFQDAVNRDPQHEQARAALDRLRPPPQ